MIDLDAMAERAVDDFTNPKLASHCRSVMLYNVLEQTDRYTDIQDELEHLKQSSYLPPDLFNILDTICYEILEEKKDPG